MYISKSFFPEKGCSFVPVSPAECPSDFDFPLAECSNSMHHNELCEADQTLPDGNTIYDVDNCQLSHDVFKCMKGKHV